MAMLALTFLVSAITLGTGRTYMMQGSVHLVLFAAFLFSGTCAMSSVA
jgi:Ca2+:H+ antiporter